MSRTSPLAALAVLLSAANLVAADGPIGEAPPGVDAAVRKGVGYLKASIASDPSSTYAVLVAYALVKADEPADSPAVSRVIAAVRRRCSGEKYERTSHHYYLAGLELMLLGEIDAAGYRPELEKILAYLLAGQQPYGAWYYPDQTGHGDTSITQYATLGLWAAERAGLDVPTRTWDRLAAWHVSTQLSAGAFTYHPTGPGGTGEPRRTMTAAGAANLLLARMYLFPGAAAPIRRGPRPEQKGKRFGVLERIDVDRPDVPAGDAAAADGRPTVERPAVEKAIETAVGWSGQQFSPSAETSYGLYYLYGVERLAALSDQAKLGTHDWYARGAEHLLATQRPDGSWTGDSSGTQAGTAFAVLFLTRATGKTLGRVGAAGLGGGLLAGGRGLPTDLNAVLVAGGEVKTRQAGGPLDELLGRLENPAATDVPAVQQAVLDAVRFGGRKTLVGQRDRLAKLVGHPDPEVRRTAYWAIGRGGELADATTLIAGLSDPDAAAAAEAHNGLCVLARRPNAFGLPPDPTAELPEDAGEAARKSAVAEWRSKAIEAWSNWYRRVAPYEEHDGLGPFGVVPSPVAR